MNLREFVSKFWSTMPSTNRCNEYQVRMIMTAPDGTQLECEVKEWIVSDRQEAIILIGSNFDREGG